MPIDHGSRMTLHFAGAAWPAWMAVDGSGCPGCVRAGSHRLSGNSCQRGDSKSAHDRTLESDGPGVVEGLEGFCVHMLGGQWRGRPAVSQRPTRPCEKSYHTAAGSFHFDRLSTQPASSSQLGPFASVGYFSCVRSRTDSGRLLPVEQAVRCGCWNDVTFKTSLP